MIQRRVFWNGNGPVCAVVEWFRTLATRVDLQYPETQHAAQEQLSSLCHLESPENGNWIKCEIKVQECTVRFLER